MSRNPSRGLVSVLVLVACLALALPAAAAPAERTPESPLLTRVLGWAESVWATVTRGAQNPWSILVAADSGGNGGHIDRGILIDPNGGR